MRPQKNRVLGEGVSVLVLASVFGGCSLGSAVDPVDEVLLGLGAERAECLGEGWGEGPLGQVIDSTSCWTMEIDSSIPDTTVAVVEALQDVGVAGDIEHINIWGEKAGDRCNGSLHEERAYASCGIRLLPVDGREDVLIVYVNPALPESDDPDAWARLGTAGTGAEVIIGIGDHVEFSPGVWVDDEMGASIRLDRDGGGEVSSLPIWTGDQADCVYADAPRFDGEVEWTYDGDESTVSVTSVNGDFSFDAKPLEVAGGDWRILKPTMCRGGWIWMYRDDG